MRLLWVVLSVVDKEYIEVYWGDVAVVVDVAVGVVGPLAAAVPFSSKRNQKRVQVLGFNLKSPSTSLGIVTRIVCPDKFIEFLLEMVLP